MTYAKKVDNNQKKIVDAARKLGYYVHHTHECGRGFPDLVMGKKGLNLLVEVKKEKGALTPAQCVFHKNYVGTIYVIHSIDELIELDKKLFGN